jgi:DNA-directed RNA polymerase specialized sigma24 family protein
MGCRAADRLVKFGWTRNGSRKPPQSGTIDCPACGSEHLVNEPSWRKPRDGERGEVELIVRRKIDRPKLAQEAARDALRDPELTALPREELARRLGISVGTVMLAVAQLRRRGELPRASDRARAALLANAGAGLTDDAIAELAGVSRVTVTRTRNRMQGDA